MIFHYTFQLILIGFAYYFFPRFLFDCAYYGRLECIQSIRKKLKLSERHAEIERMQKLEYAHYFLFPSACAFFFCIWTLQQEIRHMDMADQIRAHVIACISAAMIWYPVFSYLEIMLFGRTMHATREWLYSVSIVGGVTLCFVGVILW